MRANVTNGKLDPTPQSFCDGLKRLKALEHQIAKIEDHLADPTRMRGYPNSTLYANWHARARHALKMFKVEHEKLEEWLAENEPSVFKRAYDLLKRLELEVDFEPEESIIMQELDEYFRVAHTNET